MRQGQVVNIDEPIYGLLRLAEQQLKSGRTARALSTFEIILFLGSTWNCSELIACDIVLFAKKLNVRFVELEFMQQLAARVPGSPEQVSEQKANRILMMTMERVKHPDWKPDPLPPICS